MASQSLFVLDKGMKGEKGWEATGRVEAGRQVVVEVLSGTG